MIITFAAISGILYGLIWGPRENSVLRTIFKTLPIAVLASGAGFAYLLEQGPALLVVALILSAFGDVFLSRSGASMFIGGLASFLIAHIMYIWLFLLEPGASVYSKWQLALVIMVCGGLIIGVLFNLWQYLGKMKIAVVLYTIVIAAMVFTAFASGQEIVLLAGVLLFAMSDAVLAHDLFYPLEETTKKITGHFVWFSYLAAQVLITWSFLHNA